MHKNYLYDEVLVKNPVLVGTIGLCPVVAICTSFKIALIMSVITILTLLVAQVLTSLILKKLPQWVRLGLYTLVGMIIVIPAMVIVNKVNAELMLAFGIYFPLLAVNPLIVRNCEREAVDASFGNAVLTSLFAGLGYSLVLIIVGLVRQFISIPVMLMPAGGFIVIAFLAAALHSVFRKVDPKFADELIENSRTNIHEKPKAKLALKGATYEDGTAPTPKKKPKIEVMTLEEAEERKAMSLPPVETTEQAELALVEEEKEVAPAPEEVKVTPSAPATEKTSRFEFITLDLSEEAKADADAQRFAEAVARSKEEKAQRQMNKRGQKRKVRENEEEEK